MTMKRVGIIDISGRYFEDYVDPPFNKPVRARELSLEALVKLVKLPGIFTANRHIWDFDTGNLRIMVESPILPLHIEGELICAVDLIYEHGTPVKCLIYRRTVIKEEAYEKTLI